MVVRLTAERCAVPLASATIRGRDSECAALDDVLDRVRDGRSSVLVLRGNSRHPDPRPLAANSYSTTDDSRQTQIVARIFLARNFTRRYGVAHECS
jgi:hypothetical protein